MGRKNNKEPSIKDIRIPDSVKNADAIDCLKLANQKRIEPFVRVLNFLELIRDYVLVSVLFVINIIPSVLLFCTCPIAVLIQGFFCSFICCLPF